MLIWANHSVRQNGYSLCSQNIFHFVCRRSHGYHRAILTWKSWVGIPLLCFNLQFDNFYWAVIPGQSVYNMLCQRPLLLLLFLLSLSLSLSLSLYSNCNRFCTVMQPYFTEIFVHVFSVLSKRGTRASRQQPLNVPLRLTWRLSDS